MAEKSLITGGAGFIGSHLSEKLLSLGDEVFVLDNLSTGSLENIKHLLKNKKFHFVKGSILDEKKIKKLVSQTDIIYHLAAAVGVKTIVKKPLESFLTNLQGTEIVLNLANKYTVPVIFTSSSEVYGKNDNLPFEETDDRVYGSVYDNRWGYALSKGASEFLALAYAREKKLPVIIVRLFNVIGPRQSSFYGMVVPRFISQALSGKPITVYNDGLQTRCFIDVRDVVNYLIKLANCKKAPNQIFNVGSSREVKIKDLAIKIKKITNSSSKIIYVPYSSVYGTDFTDMIHRKADISKVNKAINCKPRFTLEKSLREIVSYFNNKPPFSV